MLEIFLSMSRWLLEMDVSFFWIHRMCLRREQHGCNGSQFLLHFHVYPLSKLRIRSLDRRLFTSAIIWLAC